jgi:hypothetical protein
MPTRLAVLFVNRSDRAGEFDRHDAKTLALLVPHVRRALMMHSESAVSSRNATRSPTCWNSMGVLLLDSASRPLFVNRGAGRITAQRDGLYIEDGELRASTMDLTLALRRNASTAAAVTRGLSLALADDVLRIHRPSGRRPYQIRVAPVRRVDPYPERSADAAGMVFVNDPDRELRTGASAVQDLYGLTPTEARVALAIANGQQVEQIGRRCASRGIRFAGMSSRRSRRPARPPRRSSCI